MSEWTKAMLNQTSEEADCKIPWRPKVNVVCTLTPWLKKNIIANMESHVAQILSTWQEHFDLPSEIIVRGNHGCICKGRQMHATVACKVGIKNNHSFSQSTFLSVPLLPAVGTHISTTKSFRQILRYSHEIDGAAVTNCEKHLTREFLQPNWNLIFCAPLFRVVLVHERLMHLPACTSTWNQTLFVFLSCSIKMNEQQRLVSSQVILGGDL